jgi:hypothetical protein
MLSPTIREELGRRRQADLTRAAQRHSRPTPTPAASSPRRAGRGLRAVLLGRRAGDLAPAR